MSQALRKVETFTYAEYATWPEDMRGELIDGVFYAQAAPLVRHQRLSSRLNLQLGTQLKGRRCQVFAAPTDVLLPHFKEADNDAGNVVQPDLFIACDPSKFTAKYLRGAPDFVCEILSPNTASHDQVRKLKLYEQHGVLEFWMIDPESRVLTIYTPDAPGSSHYGRPQVIEAIGSTPLAVIENVLVDWDEAFAE